MKACTKKWSAACLLVLLLFLVPTVVWPEFRYNSASRKYKFGFTAETLEGEIGIHIELRKNGNFLEDGADDLNRRRHFCYDAYVSRDFVLLDFNDFHELIAITKTTPLAKLGFRDRRLHSMFN